MSTRSLTKNPMMVPSLFDDFFKPWNEWFDKGEVFRKTLTVPAVNISENTDRYKVSMAAPGLKKEDFKIDLDGNMLTISAETEEKFEETEEKATRKEYSFTSFSRSFTLPEDVNKEKIDAHYEDGVLKLDLPKKEEAKKAATMKQIAVK